MENLYAASYIPTESIPSNNSLLSPFFYRFGTVHLIFGAALYIGTAVTCYHQQRDDLWGLATPFCEAVACSGLASMFVGGIAELGEKRQRKIVVTDK